MNARCSETVAAAIVHNCLKVPVRRTDCPTAPPSTADFEIVLPAATVPLEVTRATDGVRISFWKALDSPWSLRVSRAWHVSVSEGCDVRNLRQVLVHELPVMEALGIDEFDVADSGWTGDEPAPAWSRLAKAGVRRARSFAANPGIVTIGASGAFTTAPEVINEMVEEELLRKSDNRKKVGPQGHLFIWVDSSCPPRIRMAMDTGWPPKPSPAIPAGPTVWVAREKTPGGHRPDRLWQFYGSWRRLL